MKLKQNIIEMLADIIMSEEIAWEQPDTCDKLQAAIKSKLSPVDAGITVGLYWDDYVTAALEYIKEKVMEKECLEIN